MNQLKFVVIFIFIVFLNQIILDTSFGLLQIQVESARQSAYAPAVPIPYCALRPYPRVYFSIFAGRQKYLTILFRYIFKLQSLNLISELHLWDFSRNEGDSRFIQNVSGFHNGRVKYFPVRDKTRWNEYYGHYATSLAYEEEDILLKVDDDILFLDVSNFSNYVCAIEPRNTHFPNIVNNDACAFVQTLHDVHNFLPAGEVDQGRLARGFDEPLTNWFMDASKGVPIHRAFISNPNTFFVNAPA